MTGGLELLLAPSSYVQQRAINAETFKILIKSTHFKQCNFPFSVKVAISVV